MSEKAEKLNKLAKDVLILSRNTLLVNLRFLDAALSQFEFFPIEESTLLTDGKHILYNPRHILENYKAAKEIPEVETARVFSETDACGFEICCGWGGFTRTW